MVKPEVEVFCLKSRWSVVPFSENGGVGRSRSGSGRPQLPLGARED